MSHKDKLTEEEIREIVKIVAEAYKQAGRKIFEYLKGLFGSKIETWDDYLQWRSKGYMVVMNLLLVLGIASLIWVWAFLCYIGAML